MAEAFQTPRKGGDKRDRPHPRPSPPPFLEQPPSGPPNPTPGAAREEIACCPFAPNSTVLCRLVPSLPPKYEPFQTSLHHEVLPSPPARPRSSAFQCRDPPPQSHGTGAPGSSPICRPTRVGVGFGRGLSVAWNGHIRHVSDMRADLSWRGFGRGLSALECRATCRLLGDPPGVSRHKLPHCLDRPPEPSSLHWKRSTIVGDDRRTPLGHADVSFSMPPDACKCDGLLGSAPRP